MPLKVRPACEVAGLARSFRLILEDHEPDVLVCGLPQTMSGVEGPPAEHLREVAGRMAAVTGHPHDVIDERLTSTEAKRILREQGLNEKQMRGKVDMISASRPAIRTMSSTSALRPPRQSASCANRV